MEKRTTKKHFLITGIFLPIVIAAAWFAAGHAFFNPTTPALAAPEGQVPVYTPTPRPDGRIIYIVKANDTLLSISLLTGIPVEELRSMNKLTGDTIYEGQELLLGLAGPPEVAITPGPAPTATPLLPTPTPKPGKGTLCILLFNDVNGDSTRQEEESSIPDGAISISNRSGSVSETVPTGIGSEYHCFEDLPEGEFTISVAVPETYNATTESSHELILKAGEEKYINFGAQVNSENEDSGPIPEDPEKKSPLLGIIGGLFLLAGLGVAIFASRLLKGR